MTEENQELLLDLLIKQATEGLNEAESARLNELGGADDFSFELTAAAMSIVDIESSEQIPPGLRSKISAQGRDRVAAQELLRTTTAEAEGADMQPYIEFQPKRSIFAWLGWAFAAAACVALAINIAMTRFPSNNVAADRPDQSSTPARPDPTKLRDELLAQAGVVKAVWAPGSKDVSMEKITGDVVWSDEKQAGYMKFHGLPVNDKGRSTYQLWIFEENQGKDTPIDGGTFDVDVNGDVTIPINAKYRTKNPTLFAVTVEKPGGVVVSKREKIAAIAKVETPAKTST